MSKQSKRNISRINNPEQVKAPEVEIEQPAVVEAPVAEEKVVEAPVEEVKEIEVPVVEEKPEEKVVIEQPVAVEIKPPVVDNKAAVVKVAESTTSFKLENPSDYMEVVKTVKKDPLVKFF